MNKRTMKKMAKAKQQAAEAAKTAETVVKTAAPAKEVKPTTESPSHGFPTFFFLQSNQKRNR